jgi:hypothetical protein
MPKSISYLDNLKKELGQFKTEIRKSSPKGGGHNTKQYSDALGQLGGSVLGKQYNDKTGKRIK